MKNILSKFTLTLLLCVPFLALADAESTYNISQQEYSQIESKLNAMSQNELELNAVNLENEKINIK